MKNYILNGSFYLILASAVTSALGAVFWMVCTRLYSPAEVGLAATLISSMALITTLTTLGFDIDIIRFWRGHERKLLIGTTHSLSFILALFVSTLVFLILVLTRYSFLSHKFLVGFSFVILSCSWTIFSLNDSVYVAQKKPQAVLLKQSLFAVMKIFFPFLFAAMGFFAVFLSWGVAALVAFTLVIFVYRIPWTSKIDFVLARNVMRFSLWNYLSQILTRARELLLPIIVTYLISPEKAAYIFIAFSVILVFQLVPKAVSKVLLSTVSGSNRQLKNHLRRSLTLVCSFSLCALLAILFFGRFALGLFGRGYAQNSLLMLYIFSVAGFFAGISEIYFAVMRAQLRLKLLAICQSVSLVVTVLLSLLLFSLGVYYIALSWLIAEAVVFIIVLTRYYDFNPIKVFT